MKKLLFYASILSLTKASAQIRVVTHTDLLPKSIVNTVYKVGMNNIYNNKLDSIEESRHKILEYATTTEMVQRKVFNSLTNVDAAIRNGKTLIYISKRIPLIYQNLAEATKLAAGKPYLATIAKDQAQVIIQRISKLQNYLNDFVLKNDPKSLINPTDRANFIHEVYQNVVIIQAMSSSLVRTFRMHNLQDAVNKVVPYQLYLNVDKILVKDVLKKVKF